VTAAYALDWLDLLARGLHVVTGIAWIGASFYFIWLDNHLEAPADPAHAARGVKGELWAVHGGGFYNAQKYAAGPPAMPANLHWFKWEAYTTLLSGLFLLAVVYYAHADLYLVDPAISSLSAPGAIALSIATLTGGWIVYDLLCRSPLAKSDRALGATLAILCALAAWGLCNVYPGRAAFLHFGAMLGTIMVLNVFFVIIPGQRKLVEAAGAGRPVDPVHGLRGKQRSVHNTYFTLPAVFTMTSNHYAWVFGVPWNWAALIAISAAAALIRVFFVARHKGRASPWPLVAAAALLAAVAIAAMPGGSKQTVGGTTAQARAIVAARCASCHAATPTHPGFAAAPKGIVLETEAQVVALAPRIREQVAARAMPPGNLTGLTDFEREVLIQWAGAR
jgi:uncharacterized membrane protein